MITPGSLKTESLIRLVAKYVQGEAMTAPPKIAADGLVYLGGGYWRLRLVTKDFAPPAWDPTTTNVIGVVLLNPDKTGSEIEVVERAVAILIGANVGFRVHPDEVT